MHVIYLDVLFAINWIMDLLIFYTVSLILNSWIRFKRHMVAAVMASSLYCLLILWPALHTIPYSLYALWTPVIPILYLYKPTTIKAFGKNYLLCTAVAALYGGVIFNLWYLLGGSYGELRHMSIFYLTGISLGVAGIFYLSFYWIRRCVVFNHLTYELKIIKDGREKEMLALMDTGNLLYTPYDHRPVIVIYYEAIKNLISEEECETIEHFFHSTEKERECMLCEAQMAPDCLIPFHSVGCHADFLWGMKVKEIRVKRGSGEKVIHNGIIGVSNEPLYADRQYEALLHPEYILEGGVAI